MMRRHVPWPIPRKSCDLPNTDENHVVIERTAYISTETTAVVLVTPNGMMMHMFGSSRVPERIVCFVHE